MVLSEDEQSRLREIERGLVEQDPRLAKRLGRRYRRERLWLGWLAVVLGIALLLGGALGATGNAVVMGAFVAGALTMLVGWCVRLLRNWRRFNGS